MGEKVYNVLFLGTRNSARSIMAEALLTTMGKGRFRGFSAGSEPTGKVNPHALEQLATTGYPLEQLRSKSWEEFTEPHAPQMDFVFTLCDNAAGETCPLWPGHPISAHWGFEDPAAIDGPEEQQRALFQKVSHQIRLRMSIFVSLPLQMLEKNAIHDEVTAIGRTPI